MQKRQIEGSDSPDRSAICSILVLSCDRHRDLWTPFFTLFERNWPECDWPIYLGTNTAQLGSASIRCLNAGVDAAWSKSLRFFLRCIETKYVLLLLEDFFLDRPVGTAEVRKQLEMLETLGGVSMRLFPNPPADYLQHGIGVLHTRAAFRVSLQAAIWDRARLLELLVDDESPWDFEIRGSKRSRAWKSGFYCAPEPVIHYQHVVERGEWFRDAAHFYAAGNIGCDFRSRPVMGALKAWKKKHANRLRKSINKMRSRWLCLVYPEKAQAHG